MLQLKLTQDGVEQFAMTRRKEQVDRLRLDQARLGLLGACGGHIWQDALARGFHHCGGRDYRAVGICVPTAPTRQRD